MKPINTHLPKIGDPVRIGAEVASGIEPGERFARVVGFLKGPIDPAWWSPGLDTARIIIRRFTPDDVDWPTGEYRRTSTIGICPIGSGADE